MEFKLRDIAEFNTTSLSKKNMPTVINYLDTSNITNGIIDEIVLLNTEYDKVPSRARRRVAENDIIYSTVRPNQKHFGFITKDVSHITVSTGFTVIKANEEFVNPYYLYSYLTTDRVTNLLQGIAENSTTAYPSIKPSDIGNLSIELPSLNAQEYIVNLIFNINLKLKTNLNIISNLEQLSQTLFKQWFIDFEFPNEEGEPYKSSGGEMVESVMGKIPINWSISKIETIAQFKNGKKITSDDRNETGIYKIFGSNGVIGYTNKTLYSAPSLVIGRVGANCGSMELSLDPCWISDNAIMCAPKNMIYYNFLYILLKKIKLKERAGGSAQPLINQSILKGLKFILPSESLVKKFHSIAYKNTQLTENLKKENEKLAEIRDTLLPKLLSGEIEIPDNFEV